MAFTKATLTGAKDTIKEGWTKFNDLIDDLLSTSSGKGASQVGIEDSAANMSADNVEDALAEIYTDTSSTRTLAEVFDEVEATTTGLTWGYGGGLFRVDNSVTDVTAGTVSLADNTVNYVEIKTSDGSVTRNTTGFTSGRIPLRQITTLAGAQTVSTDKRAWFTQVAAATGATTTTAGIIEIATNAEVITGTATGLAVVPSSVTALLENTGTIDKMVDRVKVNITSISDNDTADLVFSFVPTEIVIWYWGKGQRETSLEYGISSGVCVVTITGTDTFTSSMDGVRWWDKWWDNQGTLDSSHSSSNTSEIVKVVGGESAAGKGELEGTGAWVTSTKTFTVTFQETDLYDIQSWVSLMAVAYR